MYALAVLAAGISAIPLVFVVWKVLRVPFRTWVPLLFFLGLILLIQVVGELIGAERITALIYLLAGAGR